MKVTICAAVLVGSICFMGNSISKAQARQNTIGALATATRKYEMKFGVSYHREWHYAFFDVTKNKGGGPLPAIQEGIRRIEVATDSDLSALPIVKQDSLSESLHQKHRKRMSKFKHATD